MNEIKTWTDTYIWVKKLRNTKANKDAILFGKHGELAVSKQVFGNTSRVNWDIIEAHGDGGVDFHDLQWDITIDVKTTQYYLYPELKEFLGKEILCDIYALVSINPITFETKVVGYIPSKKFCSSDYYVKDYRKKGERYVAKEKDMLSYDEAVEFVVKNRNTFEN